MLGILRTLSFAVLVTSAVAIAEPKPPPPPPTSQPGGVTLFTVPERLLPDPAERGKQYPVPPTKWETRPVLWGWSSVLPDGSGLSFGGVHQLADDGIAHTCAKDGANWKPIVDDLRKANPLQPRVAQVRALRNTCKDAIATARHIYFEGATSNEQARLIVSGVNPSIDKLAADLGKFITDLKAQAGLPEYESGQVAYALKHLTAAAGWIKPINGAPSVEPMANLRRGQIELEMAAEAFDAEPPPRSLSLVTWEPKSKLFVIFGGDHEDYLMNDTWVLDLDKKAWTRAAPDKAPSPRAGHQLFWLPKSGRVALYEGYIQTSDTTYRGADHAVLAPLQLWLFDAQAGRWDLAGSWPHPAAGPEKTTALPPVGRFYGGGGMMNSYSPPALAADAEDTLVLAVPHMDFHWRGWNHPAQTWALRVDPAKTDNPGREKLGTPPNSRLYRTGIFRAEFCEVSDAPPDTGLDKLPDNRWVKLPPPPRNPCQGCRGRDWATAVWDRDHDQILL